jgi:hypothetical protein
VGVNLAIRVMRPGAPICSTAQANASVAPRQRSASTSVKSGASGTQRRQFLEEQRALHVSAEDVRGKLIDGTVARYQSCGRLGSDLRNPGITVRRVADQREVVGDVRRRDTELCAHARVVANLPAPAIDLHDTRA